VVKGDGLWGINMNELIITVLLLALLKDVACLYYAYRLKNETGAKHEEDRC
jgi:hypothetical protein